MRLPFQQPGACDCHSHVFGPFDRYPLAENRAFDPPESPITQLEEIWKPLGITRAVIVQGSAYGNDHRAMLAAIARSPQNRRGVAVLDDDVSERELSELHVHGVRAVRFNWTAHLMRLDVRTRAERLLSAERLLEKIGPLGWHVELHLDSSDLWVLRELKYLPEMPIVIDHMARIDLAAETAGAYLEQLLDALESANVWVKISGSDRLTVHTPQLEQAALVMKRVLASFPNRCVWGLDWPHVNLARKRSDTDLASLLCAVAGDNNTLQQVLVRNPERLYDFPNNAVA